MKDNAMPPENDIELLARLEKDYDLGYDAQTEDRYYAVDKKSRIAKPLEPSTNSELYRELQLASRLDRDTLPTQRNLIAALQHAMQIASKNPLILSQRACRIGDDVWYDLKDDDGNALRISADRTNLSVERTPDSVCWLRGSTMKKIEMPDPLPIINPKSQFRRFADLIRQDDNTAAQLIAVAVHCLIHPAGPSSQPPLVLLEGPQGSGKSTTSLLLHDLTDPETNRVEISAACLTVETLQMLASMHMQIVLGNASKMDKKVFDTLCVMVTGGVSTTRKLYSQTEMASWRLHCQAILTGISIGRLPEDIVSRMIHIDLMPSARSMTEAKLWRIWDESSPALRMMLWRTCQRVLRMEHDDEIPSDSLGARLRDYEMTLRAVDMIFNTNGESTWLSTLDMEQHEQGSDDPVYMAIVHRWDKLKDKTFTGEELYAELRPTFTLLASGNAGTQRVVPGSARSLSASMARVLPVLASAGIDVTLIPGGGHKGRKWQFRLAAGVLELPPDQLVVPDQRAFDGMDV